MKRTLLLTVLAAALFSQTKTDAQIMGVNKVKNVLPKVDLGVKLGVNMGQLSGGSAWKDDYNAGIMGGVFVGVHKNKIGVQAEALVKSVKYELSTPSASINKVNAVYLDVPVLFQYKIVSRVWLQAGPQFSLMMSAKDNNDADVKDNFKSADISGVVGVDVRLPFRLSAGARYILGFSNINDNPGATDSWKNRAIQAYIGFRIL
ncbi:MAG: porin family protein [Bacteroidota bacterium]